ncbi:MAG: 50S ribosomal protein L4 [Armatimonadetes bacterium]|nr:50S ribosomal protein L4 [Armatimonadota bacterium]
MPRVDIVDSEGTKVGQTNLKPQLFGIEVNVPVMHQAVVAHLAKCRQGTHDTLTRAEVAGGGAKPYRQKGTGRARQGSIRAPHYRHGGVVFGPHPRSHDVDLPKKMRRLALRSAFSSKAADKAIIVLDQLTLESISTRKCAEILTKIGANGKTLLVLSDPDQTLIKSLRNIPWVQVRIAPSVSSYDLLNADQVVVTKAALDTIQEVHAK